MREPGRIAIGTWSGGRFMHFGEPLDEERLRGAAAPGDGIDTVLTADAYGQGEADALLGRALAGVPRDDYCLVGAVGHDFYAGEREGAQGFPRFTDPRAARRRTSTPTTCAWRPSAASSARAPTRFDLLLLHNPDRTGYTARRSGTRWPRCARRA